ncbi:16S rRNA (guanine(966)-N(2))-methyltransferase RsmD [Yimella sp. cx-51]|uniref:16S rRNA (guanine(966)-N(2))-methyltransferase RsmD n=1 Tax=Yimella sp. cx-51 TaxID=2770551 RepID=UPI00165D4BA8|nr:16S rRNA (guanine(966)-N(2))-methyltransferase RsmD [Yimella sp. cx-51]MBC9956730.1 16S rRNA (guanine(966)-N(2))-methyltransferase RsmD [Yimella sp. cx-51]QTH38967.1 16S rRNA (guanine(966)-N(2))-methyltransferase RsmD [Yimella sp. cx-51]
MTRIIAGTAGGRRLATPPGDGTRPTSERVREALFARLEHMAALPGAHVLDLYAGSGALGLEAASRGAASVTLVERDRKALAALQRNVRELGIAGVTVRGESVEKVVGALVAREFDLVLIDPPYDLSEHDLAQVLERLAGGWLAQDALLVVERSTRSAEPMWPGDVLVIGPRRYGETTVWFAEYVPEGDAA